MNGGGIFAGTNRGGGEAITSEKITLSGTIKEISFFSLIYAITCLLQLTLLAIEAALIGALSGFAFLSLALLFEFPPSVFLSVRPTRFGVAFESRYWNAEKPSHIKQAQALLSIAGLILAAVLLTGDLPCPWPWGATLEIGGSAIVLRLVAIFGLPFVFWLALLFTQWSAEKEAIMPKFREAAVGEVSPTGVRGPRGEPYVPSRMGREEQQRPTPVTVVEPRPYSDRQLENEGGQG